MTPGRKFIADRAARNTRVKITLIDIGRAIGAGDQTAEKSYRRTLDDLIFARDDDAKPVYTDADVGFMARLYYYEPPKGS